MATDIVYPSLIVLGCLLIVVVVHLLTRPKPSTEDINLPKHSRTDGPLAPKDLRAWHVDHEAAVLTYFDLHDPADDVPDAGAAADGFEAAIVAHPSPEMRAELAALRTAAEGFTAAQDMDDDAASGRHREVYVEYRNAWLERLRQFSINDQRLGGVRSRDLQTD